MACVVSGGGAGEGEDAGRTCVLCAETRGQGWQVV